MMSSRRNGGPAATLAPPAPQPSKHTSHLPACTTESRASKLRRQTPLRRTVRYYNVLSFPSPVSGVAACRRITEALKGKSSQVRSITSHRGTLWIAPSGLADGSCHVYACDVALDTARELDIDAPVVAYADDTQLPQSSCLYPGDDTANSSSERKLHSANLLAMCMESMRRTSAPRGGGNPIIIPPEPDRAEAF